MAYKAVTIKAGKGGFGGPLTLVPTATRNKVVSITGGGIHPVAAKIAEMTGCEAVDGFSTGVPDNEIMVAIVDCGGTARCGVYPKKRIFTVNVLPVGQTGPLAKFITEDIYVSAVNESCISYAEEVAVEEAPSGGEMKSVTIKAGKGGFGGPLTLVPTATRNKVVSITGGGIHPVAAKIAEMTGCEAVDGFSTGVPDNEIMVAIVDCGGTARCGVYPKKRIFTVNVLPVGQTGPLAKFITPDIYVSAVDESCISYADASAAPAPKPSAGTPTNPATAPKTKAQAKEEIAKMNEGKEKNLATRIGIAIGGIVNKFYAAGRETIDITVKTILPFMAFVSMILGIISASGAGDVIANTISPIASTLPGMVAVSFICAIPFISPVLGPGAVIAQVVGTLLGVQIGMGNIPPQYALPALFAIDAQVGCDFIPVGMSLGEAEPETIELGVPAILYSRLITGPVAVVIAYFFSIGLYS